jgi:hypothetical protein
MTKLRFSACALFLIFSASPSFAASCPDTASQEEAGLQIAMPAAKQALPQLENIDYSIMSEKFHHLHAWQKLLQRDLPDFLTFDIVLGKKNEDVGMSFSPYVLYKVTVDTNCVVTTQIDTGPM